MPPQRKKKEPVKIYTEQYSTEGQRVSADGSQVRMTNGRLFQRTVLPAGDGLDIKKRMEQEEVIDLNQMDFDPDQS